MDIANGDVDFDNYLTDAGDSSSLPFHLPKIKKLINISRCKVCKKSVKSLKQHLNKAKDCKVHYTESDMNDIDEKVRNFSKENKKRLNAKSYQRNKADLSKNYKDNREKILIKRSEYQAENKQKIKETKKAYYKRSIEKISKKNANYYQDHKDHLKAQKRKRKQDSEEAIRKIWIESGKKRCYERFVELQKEAREQNIKMKVHFELTALFINN